MGEMKCLVRFIDGGRKVFWRKKGGEGVQALEKGNWDTGGWDIWIRRCNVQGMEFLYQGSDVRRFWIQYIHRLDV